MKHTTAKDKANPDTGEIEHDHFPLGTPARAEEEYRKWAPPFLRTPYNYDMNEVSDETGLNCPEPTRAQQQFRDDADINTLVERFGLTGEMPQLTDIPYNDEYVPVTDYHAALNQLKAHNETFMTLPHDLRRRFDNDPGKFVAWASDEKNMEEMGKLGLLNPAAMDKLARQRDAAAAPPPAA